MNYTYIVKTAKAWGDRHDTEVDDAIPAMILFVESMVDRHIKIGRGSKRVLMNPNLDTEEGYYSLPEDFNSARVLRVNGCPVSYMTPEQILVTKAQHFSILANQLYITNIVEGDTIELVYVQKVSPISPDNPTNWMLTEYPDLYMCGMMYWLERFVKNYDVAEGWMSHMVRIMDEIILADAEDRWSGHTLQVRPE